MALILPEGKSVFMTDSRYKLQSQKEVDSNHFEIMDPSKQIDLDQVIASKIKNPELEVAIDGSLFSIR